MSDYEKMTVGSDFAIKRFSHGRRYRTTLELLDVTPGAKVLDYGAGDGHLMSMVAEAAPSGVQLFAYEPVESMFKQLCDSLLASAAPDRAPIKPIRSLNYIPISRGFDRITCCEVFEHLPFEARLGALYDIARLLAPDGFVVVSVPIEVGMASVLKNAARLAMGQAHPGTTMVNLFRSFFGLPIERPDQDGFIPSHIGFYYQDLELEFKAAGFRIVRRKFSPFPWLHQFVNSQVFYVLRRSL